jgi:translation initiation factor eIF-2B subunit epsilon
MDCILYLIPLFLFESRDSKWSKSTSGVKIVPIMLAKETFSVGDAMRDVYTRGIVTSDFVLVMGDLVSNVKIDQVVRAHKERRKINKDAIMTMVVKESGVRHRTRYVRDHLLDIHTCLCEGCGRL